MKNSRPGTAAIVPAYNENARIGHVIETLVACPDLDEIIVVDDGSIESLAWIKAQFPTVELIRHPTNRGKAAALESGVEATECELLFFCDADLVGLRPEHVTELIKPVASGTYMMSVGLRSNLAQRVVFLFALNSGERCIRKSDWLSLPVFYKKGFRIETGLNIMAWRQGGKIFHHQFPYRQTLRESKYGFFKGMHGRMRLCRDVFSAWIYALINSR